MPSDDLPSWRQAAAAAAVRAGVTVDLVDDVAALDEVNNLIGRVWGGYPPDGASVNMLKALAHTGNYVAGAWSNGDLVGAAVGFAHGPGHVALHSHIAGVAPGAQRHGVGYALKLHQAAWAWERGVPRVTWTFDPLIRRNAWFNLIKLHARIEAYYPDFYGPMADGINKGDMTDRCLVVWELAAGPSPPAAPTEPPPGAVVILGTGADGGPLPSECRDGAGVLLCQVPPDAVEMRHRHPGLAGDWRLALRAALGQALAAGAVATGFTATGQYVLERRGG